MTWSKTTPAPGSDAAVLKGCTCPVLDNGRGAGRGGDGTKFGWWINEACPVHRRKRAHKPPRKVEK